MDEIKGGDDLRRDPTGRGHGKPRTESGDLKAGAKPSLDRFVRVLLQEKLNVLLPSFSEVIGFCRCSLSTTLSTIVLDCLAYLPLKNPKWRTPPPTPPNYGLHFRIFKLSKLLF